MSYDYMVAFPGLGIEPFGLNRVAFSIFGLQVYWYGLLIALAAIVCMLLAFRHARAFDLTADDIVDALLLIIPLMIVFARLYYVVFQWDYYSGNPVKIFDTRDGGLAFYGGLIGGVIGMLIFSKWKKRSVGDVLDFVVVYVPLGQAIGRWGNFFNQEAFGNNTKLPWGMISNGTANYLLQHPELRQDPTQPVHPTFFYEFLANLLIFVVLYQVRKQSKIRYETLSWYFVLYGSVRFFVESIRTDSLYIGETNIRVSMLVSALMVIGGLTFLGRVWLRDRRLTKAEAVTPEGVSADAEAETSADGSYAAIPEADADPSTFKDVAELYEEERQPEAEADTALAPETTTLQEIAEADEFAAAGEPIAVSEAVQMEAQPEDEFSKDQYAEIESGATDRTDFADVVDVYAAAQAADGATEEMIAALTEPPASAEATGIPGVSEYLEAVEEDQTDEQ